MIVKNSFSEAVCTSGQKVHILTHVEDASDSRPESAENGKVLVDLKTYFKCGCSFPYA